MWSLFGRQPQRDFPYEIGKQLCELKEKSVWRLHSCKKKGTGEEFSIFIYDDKQGPEVQYDLAKASLKRLKTLRHPNILTYIDSLEGDKLVYVVTECVEPLEVYLQNRKNLDNGRTELAITWGVHQLLRALCFLNNNCSLSHNNICISSIFVNKSGEWKVGGTEYMNSVTETLLVSPGRVFSALEVYEPPERKSGFQKPVNPWSVDVRGLGLLIWEVFNGSIFEAASVTSSLKIPKNLASVLSEMMNSNPGSRPNPSVILQRCRSEGGYLKNSFVDVLLFLEEIQIKESEEKSRFFSSLSQQLESFPDDACRCKILPQLLSAFEFGCAGPAILTPMFKLGKLLDEDEYQKKIVPCIVKLFSSPDRATRARLLQQIEHFVEHLLPNVVNNQIFPEIIHGFSDTNATIREITVKSMLHLAPKLSNNNLNIELMKHFARLQAKDDQGGIRTNTTVCLGKISHHLHPETRKKVLVVAFTRAMRDPFPPARTAGILALAATQKFFLIQDVASRVLPALCTMTVDPEKNVREQAFKAIKGFLHKLERVSEDPSLAEEMEAEVNTASSVTATDVAKNWAGWAFSSLTSKFYKADIREKDPTTDCLKPEVITNPNTKSETESKQVSPTSGRAASDSGSDYDEFKLAIEDWGEMEMSNKANPPDKANTRKASSPDGDLIAWDNDDFTFRADSKSAETQSSFKPASLYNWGDTDIDLLNVRDKGSSENTNSKGGWEADDTSWATWEDSFDTSKPSAVKSDRDQKREQRRHELEIKRAARAAGSTGPMKLGERKKIPQL